MYYIGHPSYYRKHIEHSTFWDTQEKELPKEPEEIHNEIKRIRDEKRRKKIEQLLSDKDD